MSQAYPWKNLPFMHSRQFASVAGPLNIVENRQNQPCQLLLLHGVLRNWRSYYPLLPLLDQANISVAVLDFRGHGNSTPTPDRYYVNDYVEDAVAALQNLAGPVVVYGHSLGAMVAMAVAARAPDRVKHLIMEDPPFETMGNRLLGTSLHRYFSGVHQCMNETANQDPQSLFDSFSNIVVGENPDGSPILVHHQRDETSRQFSSQCLGQVDPQVLATVVQGNWLDGFDWKNISSSVQCESHLMQSDSACGGMLNDADALTVMEQMKGRCKRIQFPNVGHSIHWQAVDEVFEIISSAIRANAS